MTVLRLGVASAPRAPGALAWRSRPTGRSGPGATTTADSWATARRRRASCPSRSPALRHHTLRAGDTHVLALRSGRDDLGLGGELVRSHGPEQHRRPAGAHAGAFGITGAVVVVAGGDFQHGRGHVRAMHGHGPLHGHRERPYPVRPRPRRGWDAWAAQSPTRGFGDGSPHSALQNPSHAYPLGPYTWTVTAVADGGDMRHERDGDRVFPPAPEWPRSPRGAAPLSVSSRGPHWRRLRVTRQLPWDFGDGATSTEQSPTHAHTHLRPVRLDHDGGGGVGRPCSRGGR